MISTHYFIGDAGYTAYIRARLEPLIRNVFVLETLRRFVLATSMPQWREVGVAYNECLCDEDSEGLF